MMNCYSTQSATNRNTEPRFIAAILDWWRFITSGFFGFTSLALAFGSILTLVAASLSTVSLPGNPAYMLFVVSVKSHGGFTCSVFFCVCFPPPLPTRKKGERGRERERDRLYIYTRILRYDDLYVFGSYCVGPGVTPPISQALSTHNIVTCRRDSWHIFWTMDIEGQVLGESCHLATAQSITTLRKCPDRLKFTAFYIFFDLYTCIYI